MGAQRIEDSYVAPVNHFIFKLVLSDGTVREFQRDPARQDGLIGLDGWDGDIGDEGAIAIRRSENGTLRERFGFFRGRLTYHGIPGKPPAKFSYEAPRRPPPTGFSPLDILEDAPGRQEAIAHGQREMETKWTDSGRLAFPYNNPNHSGALYAELSVLALVGLSLFRRRRIKVLFGVLAAAFAVCVVLTGSRGALLGLFVGMAAMAAFRARRLFRSRLFWGVAVLAVAVAALVLALGGHANMTRGFTSAGGLDWSNAIRLDMWKTAPRLMDAAPGGWGLGQAGKAYFDWYQPVDALCLTGSLMNDHLTMLAEVGWPWRFAYAFALFLILAGGFWVALKRGDATTLAVWTTFAAMAWFNPLYPEWGLWIIPVAALLPLGAFFVRRLRDALGVSAVAAVAAGATLALLAWAGSGDSGIPDRPPVHVDGPRILVNGRNPRIWIVDDGRGALGGMLAGRDIRTFYAADRHLPSLGYVRNIADLPTRGVDRLVLAGKAGNDWLLKLSSDENARRVLPKSIVFLSPPFLPSEVPEGVLACCRPQIVVGEFAARYQAEYAKPPSWVTIVPGMEKYILLWPQFVFGG